MKNKLTVRLKSECAKIKLLPCVLALAVLCAACSSPFAKKYESASELFTEFNKLKEGSFVLDSDFKIEKGENQASTGLAISGVTDGNAAVFDYNTVLTFADDSHYVNEPIVYIEDVQSIRSKLMFALLDACGSRWDRDDNEYLCGTDDNSVTASLFSYLADCAEEADSAELHDYIEAVSQAISQDETESVLNTSISFDGKAFSEKISGSFVTYETRVDFTLEYKFEQGEADYSSDSDYAALGTALAESFEDVYKAYGADAGIYEREEQEITSHVVDGSSLIVQGFDDIYYKIRWDGYKLNYSEGDLDYGRWVLALTEDKDTTVNLQMFLDDDESLIQWYYSTYGDEMEITHEAEKIDAAIGTVTHAVVTMTENGRDYVNDMYLYQVSDEFLIQVTVNNPTGKYTDLEMLDMALTECTAYGGE